MDQVNPQIPNTAVGEPLEKLELVRLNTPLKRNCLIYGKGTPSGEIFVDINARKHKFNEEGPETCLKRLNLKVNSTPSKLPRPSYDFGSLKAKATVKENLEPVICTTTAANKPTKNDDANYDLRKRDDMFQILQKKRKEIIRQAKTGAKKSDPDQPKNSNITDQNIFNLSLQELDRLTSFNTSVNAKYSRPVQVTVVKKKGIKPLSPKANSLSKVAALARRLNSLDNIDSLEYRKRKVKWTEFSGKNNTDLPVNTTTETSSNECLKSCLRKPSRSSVEGEYALSKSPVFVTKFEYEPVRRLTYSISRSSSAPPRRSSLITKPIKSK